ncbi:MAG: NUDIX domain-containing protein [Candidatus Rokubacteria bacterium]|nr:NUDIX domain-containing protein [Candidatus Rokubacteria bacterium]
MDGRFLVVVAFLIERDGHVLLLRRSPAKDHAPGEWDVGSGRVRQGESPLEAVLREAKEETGLSVDVIGPLDTFHFYRGRARAEAVGITFHCRATGGELTVSPEHDEARWVPIEQLLDLDCADWMRRCFAAFLARRAPAAGAGPGASRAPGRSRS